MGLTDLFSDFLSTMTFTEARAEAPADDDDAAADQPDEASDEGSKADDAGDAEGGEEGAGEDDDEAGGDEAAEEEEEEEEDEPVDPKPRLEEECAKSAQCAPARHHYEECAERVQHQKEDPNHKGPVESCVEEFFHLQHCASQCAAPKLFRVLK